MQENFKSVRFLRTVFPVWIVLCNDTLAEAEGISAETHIIPSVITQHIDLLPDLLPVLRLFCCGQTLSGRKVEAGRAELSRKRPKSKEQRRN